LIVPDQKVITVQFMYGGYTVVECFSDNWNVGECVLADTLMLKSVLDQNGGLERD